ncbi:MAG: Hsp70 family protein [Micrococcales bacterium]|nr:Hsp70 family protein [Micrococcales bacterium]
MGWVLAIDFGSVNTAAAWTSEGRIETVRLEASSHTMPSAVARVDGCWLVGQSALDAHASNPDTFVATPKARLGYEPVQVGSTKFRASTVVSQVLEVVRDRAVAAAGGTGPERVILTHPEHWEHKRQAALLNAALLAGLPAEMTILVPEPVASVQASTVPASLPVGSRVAVVDVGGGTCDVTILESTPGGGLKAVAREGDERLGGNDFDDLLYRWLADRLDPNLVAILADPAHIASRLAVLELVRQARHTLSEHPAAQITVSVAGDNQATVTVTRAEYEQIIDEPLQRVAALVGSALVSSRTRTLTQLFLTGGSARTPAVARVVHEATGMLGVPPDDPKTATVVGALRTVPAFRPEPLLAPVSGVIPAVAVRPPSGPQAVPDGQGNLTPVGNPPDGPSNRVPEVPVAVDNPSKRSRRRTIIALAATPLVVLLVAGGAWAAHSSKNDLVSPATVAGQTEGATEGTGQTDGTEGGQGTSPDSSPYGPPDGLFPGELFPGGPFPDGTPPEAAPDAGQAPTGSPSTPPATSTPTTRPSATPTTKPSATPSPAPQPSATPAPKPSTTPTTKPSANPTPTTKPVAEQPPLRTYLTPAAAVGSNPQCADGWKSGTAKINGTSYSSTLTCTPKKGSVPYLEYKVPSGATRLTFMVGIADGTSSAKASVRFAVYAKGSSTPLWEMNVSHGKAILVDVPVSGRSQVRLELTRVGEIPTTTTAVWASPMFS